VKILVGTSSWTDPTLIKSGLFYPRGTNTAEKRLVYYAKNFPLVEVDSSYYYLPTERNAALWVERTPPDFTFDVKAYSLFTHHPTRTNGFPATMKQVIDPEVSARQTVYDKDLPAAAVDFAWEEFRRALMPLDSAGKLGAVLFQFPRWFACNRANKQYLLECRDRLPTIKLAIEFRQHTWLDEEHRERTVSFLAENGLALVNVDGPQGFDSSVPPTAEVTSDVAIVRFHGRNREAWAAKGLSAAERFRYLYSEEELAGWVGRIRRMAAQAKETHVLMNNCYSNYAVLNAMQLAEMLGDVP